MNDKQSMPILITGGNGQLGMDCTQVLGPDYAVTAQWTSTRWISPTRHR
jgi:dTDP-4-dehydrorhamnose reductase